MRLSDYLETKRIGDATFAGQIGTTAMAVSRYRRAQRIPRPEILEKIAAVTSGEVGPSDFYTFAPPTSERRRKPKPTPRARRRGVVRTKAVRVSE